MPPGVKSAHPPSVNARGKSAQNVDKISASKGGTMKHVFGSPKFIALLQEFSRLPFSWTKTADEILAGVARVCKRTLETGH